LAPAGNASSVSALSRTRRDSRFIGDYLPEARAVTERARS
jgi:hypothetical protein